MKQTILVALALSLVSSSALAADTWTDPFPGVRRLQRTQSNPNWRISAVVVDLCAEGVSFRATKSAEKRRTPSSFGTLVGADIVVNGDFFSFETYNPSGFAVGDGAKWRSDTAGQGWIGFGGGYAEISRPGGSRVEEPAWVHDAVGGNRMVLTNGTVTNDSSSFCTTRHPRTVAGLSADGRTLYLVVVDGRQTSSVGMTCTELGTLMKGLGADDALNLDGGGSSAMWVRGPGVVNSPSDGTQRVVSNHLGVIASGSGEPEACNLHDGEIGAEYLGLDDFYTGGTSEGIPDVLVGDEFQGAIWLKSKTPRRWRGTKFDYWFETPYLSATGYEIQSDHPAYDQTTWVRNDASDNPDNPAVGALGATGSLLMHAFTPDETKRVLLDLRAGQYSVGSVDHPDVRAWIHHIDDIYGEQTAFDGEPSNANRFGKLMNTFAQLDVLSPYEWQFEDGGTEGWMTCGDGVVLEVADGALPVDGCVQSPTWTKVDAATYDQAVVNLVAAGDLAVGLGDELIQFEGLQPGINVLDLSSVAAWTGEILSFNVQGSAAIDGLWFQNSADRTSSSGAEVFAEAAPLAPATEETTNPTDPGNNGGNNSTGNNGNGNGTSTGTNGDSEQTPGMDGERIHAEGGCAVADPRPGALFLAFLLFAFVRRPTRRDRRP